MYYNSNIISYRLPLYTDIALMIIRSAYVSYQLDHNSSWANNNYGQNPDFNFELSPDGQIVYCTNKPIANINKNFAKAICHFLFNEKFMDGNNPDKNKEVRLSNKIINDKKSDKLIAFEHSWERQYRDIRPDTIVKCKISDIWLIYDYLMNGCSLDIDYPADQIKNIIGKAKNPIQIEQLTIINAEKEKIKEKYDVIIQNNYVEIDQKIQELREEHEEFKKKQQEYMKMEFEKIEKIFETA